MSVCLATNFFDNESGLVAVMLVVCDFGSLFVSVLLS